MNRLLDIQGARNWANDTLADNETDELVEAARVVLASTEHLVRDFESLASPSASAGMEVGESLAQRISEIAVVFADKPATAIELELALTELVSTARSEGAWEMREAAAKVAESWPGLGDDASPVLIAAAIRRLPTSPSEEA